MGKVGSRKKSTGHRLSNGVGRTWCQGLIYLFLLTSLAFMLASPVLAAPTIFPSPLPNGQVGTPYSAALTAAPLTCPCTWTITSGALPPGLTLDSTTGVISGTPTTAGTFPFFVTVTDTTGTSPQQGFFITISAPPLKFLTASLSPATEGESYSEAIRVSGGKSPYTWTIISGNLPTGLTLGTTTGYISGTPVKGSAGTYSFIVEVTDSSVPPVTGQQSLNLTVEKGGYEAIITIGTGLKAGETKVFLNGSHVATLRGGQSLNLNLDLGISRSVRVEPIIQHPTESGIRFKAEVDRLTVSETSPHATFPYHTEYSIELKSEPPNAVQLSGGGWYKQGYILRTTAPDEVNDEDEPGTQYRFSHWVLPTGETTSSRDMRLTISAPGSCTAKYDTYYKLSLISDYGEVSGSGWYKSGTEAVWSTANPEVRMSGILGIFGGKLTAVNPSGSVVMHEPKTIDIVWEPNYTLPMILMPLAILLLIFGGYGLYLLLRSLQPKPMPYPPTYQPIPPPPPTQPPQTTVVMIGGDKPKLEPPTTREQLMEKFGELLQKYEEEIRASMGTKEPPEIKAVDKDKRLPAPEPAPLPTTAAEAAPLEEGETCNFVAKKPTRVVVSSWEQSETKTISLPPAEEERAGSGTALTVTWTRDIYQEWEILKCWLPRGHTEPHEGSLEVVYSRLSTATEERTYMPGQELVPPEPHYTNDMPQVAPTAEQVIPSDKLPPETMS